MATIQTKEDLLTAVTEGYTELTTLIDSSDKTILERDFAPSKANAKCTTYTTTMGAYFACVTSQPYGKTVKSLKAHLKNVKKQK